MVIVVVASVKLLVPVPVKPPLDVISGITPVGMPVAPATVFRVIVPPVAAAARDRTILSAPGFPMSKKRLVVAELVVSPVPVPVPRILNVPIAASRRSRLEPLFKTSEAPALVVVALPMLTVLAVPPLAPAALTASVAAAE